MNKTIIELREEAIKEDKNPEFYLYQKLEEKGKEIERILATSGKYITYAERCYVLDYITNLQEENKMYAQLKDNIEKNNFGIYKNILNWSAEELDEAKRIEQKSLDTINNLQEENERLNKDLETAIDICNQRQKEIVRLNNVINELEKELREGSFDVYFCSTTAQKNI